MIPTVFASAYIIFPRSRMGLIVPLIGLVATLAPTIGPTVGGYLTDALSWHWLFFINVVPGIVVTVAALDADRFRQARLIAVRATSTGSGLALHGRLSRRARICAGGRPAQRLVRRRHACCCLPGCRASRRVVFFARVLHGASSRSSICAPSRTATSRSARCSPSCSASASTASPISIRSISAQIRGYNALMIGETMFVSGLAMFLTAPIAGRLMTKVDPRFMLMVGFLCFRRRHLVDDLSHQGLGFLGAALAADLPRRRADAGDDPDQQHRARHAAAGAGEERLRPLQSDAQSRRRGRARRHSPPSSTTAPTCILPACTRRSPGRVAAGARDAQRARRSASQSTAAMRKAMALKQLMQIDPSPRAWSWPSPTCSSC